MASPLQAHFRRMARYNRWAYDKVFAAAKPLTPSQAHADVGLPFLSVAGTLNHLLLADALWYLRFTGRPAVDAAPLAGLKDHTMGDIEKYWNGAPDDWATVASMDACEAATLAMADRWTEVVDGLSEEEMAGAFTYHNTRGEPMKQQRGPILTHVFNHATHHRGQITAALCRLSGDPGSYPAIDLLYFLEPDA